MMMAWMDKGDIWLPQKIHTKTDAAVDTFNHREHNKLTILVTSNVVTSVSGLPDKADCLLCHITWQWSVIVGHFLKYKTNHSWSNAKRPKITYW